MTADESTRVAELEARKARLSEDRRALLARRLAGVSSVATIPKREEEGPAPLSFAQQRLWYLAQLDPDTAVYNVPMAFRLRGPIAVDALLRAWDAVVHRHEVLRTVVVDQGGQPLQRVLTDARNPMEVRDLSAWPPAQRTQEVERLMSAEAARPFDLHQGPLARASLLRLSDLEHQLVLVLHHIVFDGWSVGVLRQELQDRYAEQLTGQSPGSTLPLQYSDYAVWQRRWLQGPELERQLAYWRVKLGGTLPVLTLPTDRPRPALQSFQGSVERFRIPAETIDTLTSVARAEGGTLFMGLLAAWKVVLARHARSDDIIVGTPIANRTQEELEKLIGYFANTLVLRTSLSGEPSYRELLQRVRETCLGAYAHQDLPFERLVEELRPARDLSRTALFQVMFALDEGTAEPTQTGEPTWEPQQYMGAVARTDLTLFLKRSETGLSGTLEYSTALFDRPSMQRLIRHFVSLVESAAAAPDTGIWRQQMVSDGEGQPGFGDWKPTVPDSVSAGPGVHDLAEIEAALGAMPAIREAAVSVTPMDATDAKIVAYVAYRPGEQPTVSEVRAFLRQRLPRNIVPSLVVEVPRVPRTPDGNVDRAQLPDPLGPVRERRHEPPATPMEALVATVWKEVLGVEVIGRNDNFFELGGHSLLSMRVVASIAEQTGKRLDPRLFFFQTVQQIAAGISSATVAGRP